MGGVVVLGDLGVLAQLDAVFAPHREIANIGEADLGPFLHHTIRVDVEPLGPRGHALGDGRLDLRLPQQHERSAPGIGGLVAGPFRRLGRVQIDQVLANEICCFGFMPGSGRAQTKKRTKKRRRNRSTDATRILC